jgi:hypothetical protein
VKIRGRDEETFLTGGCVTQPDVNRKETQRMMITIHHPFGLFIIQVLSLSRYIFFDAKSDSCISSVVGLFLFKPPPFALHNHSSKRRLISVHVHG